MACDHSEYYEIGVDYLSIERFTMENGKADSREGDPTPYGTFTFHCHQCGFNHLYRSDSKRPKWLSKRIATLNVKALT